MSHENVIREALKPFIKAENRREDAADKVYDALDEAGAVLDGYPATVEVRGARVAVSTVHVHGLVIRVDASGNAVSVYSPDGFEITEYQKVVA